MNKLIPLLLALAIAPTANAHHSLKHAVKKSPAVKVEIVEGKAVVEHKHIKMSYKRVDRTLADFVKNHKIVREQIVLDVAAL
ncbi:hypothetical protein ACMXYX_18090 (plasmid) [Neptuniibacter sp. QD72_48]|uniref:hypothetical protein n=1 Tax=Neptuniibacter sp. QD72_48 TaxID=3398214 RepID=UPI0039F5866D